MMEQGSLLDGERVRYFDTNIKRQSRLQGHSGAFIFRNIISIVRQFVRVFWAVSEADVAVVHSCSSGGLSFWRDIYAAIIARLFAKRFVLHLHFGRLPDVMEAGGGESLVFRLLVWMCDALIVLDMRSLEALRESFPGKEVVLIPNSTNAPLADSAANRQQVVVFAGWVVKTKGVEELLAAWDRIEKNGWRLLLIGPYENVYMDSLRCRFGFSNVDVLGEIDHELLLSTFQDSMIMCLPSYTEGFPFVVIEAMASGCAVVASSVGAIPEILRDDAGILVPKEDSIVLQAVLENLMADPHRIGGLSKRAIAAVQDRYQLCKVYEQYKSVWRI